MNSHIPESILHENDENSLMSPDKPAIIEQNDMENKGQFASVKKSPTPNLNSLILSCVKSDEYCYSMLDYMKKMYHFSQIDYYLAYIQILYCFKPKEINEMAKIRKHLKNQWARDDPGFLIIVVFNLFISSISYCLAFGRLNIFFILQFFFFQAFFIFITIGILIAVALKLLAERYLKNEDLGFNRNQSVEYVYAFDIHCNAFVPFYTFSSVVPYVILPLVLGNSYFHTIVSNVCLLVGILYYCYVTLMGYYSLPFVKKNKYLTLVVWPIISTFLFATLLRFNFLYYCLDSFFNI